MKTKTDIAKLVIRTVVQISTSTVVGAALRNNVAPKNLIQKGEVFVASYVVGALVAERAGAWSDRQVDAAVSWWNTNVIK